MKTRVTIEFKFGTVRDEAMSVTILADDKHYQATTDNTVVSFDVDLPTDIKITVAGKNNQTDTIVDSDGNIVEDKFVQIVNFALDCFTLDEIFLHQRIKFLTESKDEYITSYFGFNGTATLNFDKDNVLEQYLACQ